MDPLERFEAPIHRPICNNNRSWRIRRNVSAEWIKNNLIVPLNFHPNDKLLQYSCYINIITNVHRKTYLHDHKRNYVGNENDVYIFNNNRTFIRPQSVHLIKPSIRAVITVDRKGVLPLRRRETTTLVTTNAIGRSYKYLQHLNGSSA